MPGHDELGVRCVRRNRYLIACGLIGEPEPPVMMSGALEKKIYKCRRRRNLPRALSNKAFHPWSEEVGLRFIASVA
jgi:hypothetical protein